MIILFNKTGLKSECSILHEVKLAALINKTLKTYLNGESGAKISYILMIDPLNQ